MLNLLSDAVPENSSIAFISDASKYNWLARVFLEEKYKYFKNYKRYDNIVGIQNILQVPHFSMEELSVP